jgi:rare lipoprotein A
MIRTQLLRTYVAVALAALGLVSGMPFAGSISQAAAAGAPKVVIIVGPVGATTASYKADADAAAAEALKYTPDVVKLYSPNATWDAVKAALQGASVVINMGHGNGFPSPYATTLQPDREDGLGLNPVAGVDDSAVTYWGEQYLASDIRLAPNAVVVLAHLCYASGSSEPGRTDPTQAVAQERVDNFAAGWLAAGARAVIAEAYGGAAANYVTSLFTAHDTIGNIWATSFSHQGNTFSFPSTRTPGMTAQMDPDTATGKYYRSIVGDLNLASDAVVGAGGPAPIPAPGTPGPTPTPSPTAPAPTPTPSPTPSPSPTGTSTGVVTATVVPPTPVTPSAGPAAGSVLWTTASVNLRLRPRTAAKVVLVLTPNTPVRLLRTYTDSAKRVWYYVRVHSRLGWVASWLTRTTRNAPAATAPATVPAWTTVRASSFGVGDGLVGTSMACGGTLTDSVMAVAHLTLPCGTKVRLRYAGLVVEAQVLDRGPYVDGLTFDLAPAVCHALGSCATITLEWQLAQ